MNFGLEVKRTAPASGGFGWLRGQGGLSINKPHQAHRVTRPRTATAASHKDKMAAMKERGIQAMGS